MEKVPRLSRDEDEYWRKISVVPDLTMKQRELERNMFKKSQERNLNRTFDEQAKNLCHKVIGKKGERVLRVLELRQDEIINQEGRVILRGQERNSPTQSREQERGQKRSPNRSPGVSPPARRSERRFGSRGRRE